MNEETNKLVEEKIEELYNSLMEKPFQVLSIFNDFFEEERVDMQGYLSLERFKSWMMLSPINEYVISRGPIGMSRDEWGMYQSMTIEELPTSQATKVINNLQGVVEKICSSKFDDIFILVHFPHVRVTNEHGRFVDINHLWAKVKIACDGTLKGGFTLNRSEYTLLHMDSGYLHSHVSRIPKDNFTEFQSPCTGSGPINGTIATLNRDYDKDMWNMFCLELSKYVTVESIEGTPYNYLEKLSTRNMRVEINEFLSYTSLFYYDSILSIGKMKDFIRYFINTKKLKFNYVNGSYSIGMSLLEYIILISNEFISWYNNLFNEGKVTATFDELKSGYILKECVINNGKIYYKTSRNIMNDYSRYIGRKVCMFKGKEITINITDIVEIEDKNKSIILNVQIALYILNIILKVLNYRYGRDANTTRSSRLNTEVRYL